MQGNIKNNNPLLPLLFLIVAALLLYFPTTNSFINIWTDSNNPTYSHGPLLLLSSLFFLVRAWKKNSNEFVTQHSSIGLILLAATSLLWLVANLGHIQFVQQIALLFIIVFLFISLLGFGQARIFLFPLFMLLFTIPIWNFTNIYLRQIAVYFVDHLLNLTGVLSVSEDFLVLIPEGTFFVDHGCSGQGQLIVALAVSCIYVYLHPMRWYTRIVLILSAILTAIITNVLRIYVVIMSGHYTNMQHYFVTTDHVTLGWVIFSVGILIYFIVANRLLDFLDNSSAIRPSLAPIDAQPALHTQIQATRPIVPLVLALAAISLGPSLSYYFKNKAEENFSATTRAYLPEKEIAGWENITAIDSHLTSGWIPDFTGYDSQTFTVLQNPEREFIEFYIFRYYKQHQGKEAISDSNRLYDDKKWNFVAKETLVSGSGQEKISMDAITVESSAGIKKLILRWYSVLGVKTKNPVIAKLVNIWGTLTHRPDISVFVLSGEIKGSYKSTSHQLQDLAVTLSKNENK